MRSVRRSKLVICVGMFLLCVFRCVQSSLAQHASALPVDEMMKLRLPGAMSRLEFSPSGDRLVYVVRNRRQMKPNDIAEYAETGVPWFGFGGDLYLTNVKTGQSRKLTDGKGSNWMPAWSPDGRFIAFLSDRDGKGQAGLWIWDSSKDTIRKLSDTRVRLLGWPYLEWTPDSQKVLVTIVPEELSFEDYVQGMLRGKATEKNVLTSVPGSTETVYESRVGVPDGQSVPGSDPLNLGWTLRDLAVVDVATGQARTLVRGKKIGVFHISRDGSFVVYSSPQVFERPGSQQLVFDLRITDLSGHADKIVASGVRLASGGGFSVSPDGQYVGYWANQPPAKAGNLYVVEIGDGEARNLTHFEEDPKNDPAVSRPRSSNTPIPLWDSSSKYLYSIVGGDLWQSSVRDEHSKALAHIDHRTIVQLASRTENVLWTEALEKSTIVITRDPVEKQEGFYRIDLTNGKGEKLQERRECYTCLTSLQGRVLGIADDGGGFAYVAQDGQHPAEIWMTKRNLQDATRLTDLNPQLREYKMGVSKLIDWLSDDGEHLQGALRLPSDYQDGTRYPLVVIVYGGEFESNAINRFAGPLDGLPYFNPQLLATRGYAVLMPDAPLRVGTPMLDLARTVLPGVNRAIEMGIANPDRLGVMGHSKGGYSTLSLIVETKRFKAALESDGLGDLMGFYGQMDRSGAAFGTAMETGGLSMGGTPWEYRNRYIENSPILYLDRVDTPLLLVHGAEDTAVAPFLGDELFVDLSRLGKTVQYVKYDGEEHQLSKYSNQVDVANRMIRWFDRYLKK